MPAGQKVNYLGEAALCDHPIMKAWLEQGRVISVCPEVQAGLPIPRHPAEIIGEGDGYSVLQKINPVNNNQQQDVTEFFLRGAQIALELAQKHDIKIAILKDGSPSCGSSYIYDGSFSAQREQGAGVTTALLERYGVKVFSEHTLEQAKLVVQELESA